MAGRTGSRRRHSSHRHSQLRPASLPDRGRGGAGVLRVISPLYPANGGRVHRHVADGAWLASGCRCELANHAEQDRSNRGRWGKRDFGRRPCTPISLPDSRAGETPPVPPAAGTHGPRVSPGVCGVVAGWYPAARLLVRWDQGTGDSGGMSTVNHERDLHIIGGWVTGGSGTDLAFTNRACRGLDASHDGRHGPGHPQGGLFTARPSSHPHRSRSGQPVPRVPFAVIGGVGMNGSYGGGACDI